jgi:hypothetical protein
MEDIIKISDEMTTDGDVSIVWFLESCPVRVGTLNKIVWKDLKSTNDPEIPYSIEIEALRLKGKGQGKFKKTKHVGFLHYYAVEKLEKYKAELKRKNTAITEDSPIFFSYGNSYSKQEDGTVKRVQWKGGRIEFHGNL